MLGFHKREHQDTFDADGWYPTGDLCSWRDGLLFFHGRGSDMIKTAGFNVAPAEVEVAIDLLDDVVYVAVLGIPDPVREQAVGAADWPEGVTDGMGAMVGAWWCNGEVRRDGGSMRDHELMRQIERYNRVDVEAMRDVLDWLRKNR